MSAIFDANKIIIRPRVTEKTNDLSVSRVYCFEILSSANKAQVRQAFWQIYGVKPVKINLLRRRGKTVTRRGRAGRRPGFKEALVYLKEGDKITLV